MPSVSLGFVTRSNCGLESALKSDGDSFDNVSRDGLLSAIVEPRGSGVGMAQEVLHVLQGHSLEQEIGRRAATERVRRNQRRQVGGREPALH